MSVFLPSEIINGFKFKYAGESNGGIKVFHYAKTQTKRKVLDGCYENQTICKKGDYLFIYFEQLLVLLILSFLSSNALHFYLIILLQFSNIEPPNIHTFFTISTGIGSSFYHKIWKFYDKCLFCPRLFVNNGIIKRIIV